MSLDNLPVEWLSLELGKVIDYGKTFKVEPIDVDDNTWVLELEDIEKDTSKILNTVYFAERKSKSTKNKFIKGDVLYGKLRPYLNKVVVAPQDGICTTEVIPLNGNGSILNKFLFYWLKGNSFQNYVQAVSYGVNMPRLGTNDGLKAPFVLAPLAEQQEIVRQLDVMLEQVEQIKARLDAIPAILKKFRQSVLEEYFNNLSAIDQVILDDLVVNIDQGWSPKCLNTPASLEQWGVIKTSSIQPLYFDASENKELPSNLEPRKKLSLKSGDVLITRAGPRTRCGVTCVVDKDYDNLMICDKVYRVRCDSQKILADYLNLYLNSLTGLGYIEKMKTGSSESGMNLTQSKFKELIIPLVNLEQQITFVKDIKNFFQFTNHIEQTVKSAQKRVNLLTQSILAKAFSGELTAEWREQHQELITGVNSAQSLLAKIQAEREASKPVKKTRAKKDA